MDVDTMQTLMETVAIVIRVVMIGGFSLFFLIAAFAALGVIGLLLLAIRGGVSLARKRGRSSQKRGQSSQKRGRPDRDPAADIANPHSRAARRARHQKYLGGQYGHLIRH